MRRQIILAAMTLVNSPRSNRPSGLRKTLSLTLILTLVIIPLLGGRTFTPTPQAQICGGANPNRIFQGCPLGDPAYESSLENAALDELLNLHQLPPLTAVACWGGSAVVCAR